jgi:SAM-dependent methyltransferase
MKKWLTEKLICPECLPAENSLGLEIDEEESNDIIEGKLICSDCKRRYQISKGLALLLPDKSASGLKDQGGYNSPGMLSSYLWSHFSDCFNDPDATDAYQVWSSFAKANSGIALDIGCAVGRLSFELSKTHSQVIGIDTSISFIKKARELLIKKRLDFDLIIEGNLTAKRSCDLDHNWNYNRTEFLVADAMALPFSKNLFSTVSSINLLEKVSHPMQHLVDVNRVLRKEDAMFIFSDPFSWDESVTKVELWLGGSSNSNKYGGRGLENIRRLLLGAGRVFDPPMQIADHGNVAWKIRKTENLWEHINSQYLIGNRK